MTIINNINLGIIALLILGIFIPSCINSELSNKQDSIDSLKKVSVETIIKQPKAYMGQTVVLEGKIGEFIKPNSRLSTFTLEDNTWFIKPNDNLLVIDRYASLTTPTLIEHQKVKIIGEIHQFFLAEFERAYNLPWDTQTRRQVVAAYEGKPVLVSNSIVSNE